MVNVMAMKCDYLMEHEKWEGMLLVFGIVVLTKPSVDIRIQPRAATVLVILKRRSL